MQISGYQFYSIKVPIVLYPVQGIASFGYDDKSGVVRKGTRDSVLQQRNRRNWVIHTRSQERIGQR